MKGIISNDGLLKRKWFSRELLGQKVEERPVLILFQNVEEIQGIFDPRFDKLYSPGMEVCYEDKVRSTARIDFLQELLVSSPSLEWAAKRFSDCAVPDWEIQQAREPFWLRSAKSMI